MKRIIRKCLCVFTAAAVMLGSIGAAQVPVWAAKDSGQKVKAGRAAAREAVTVTTREQFMEALQQNKSPITVDGIITLVGGTDADNRMMPVEIPAGTMIQGTGNNSSINCRGPIQIKGDGVCFKNLELTFSSGDALDSVPHREIFLAGHSLTLDNVNYLALAGICPFTTQKTKKRYRRNDYEEKTDCYRDVTGHGSNNGA